MREIGQFANLLRNMDSAVLAATAWGGTDVFDTNVYKTGQLLNCLIQLFVSRSFTFHR